MIPYTAAKSKNYICVHIYRSNIADIKKNSCQNDESILYYLYKVVGLMPRRRNESYCFYSEFCFCHAACWSCATERREPCQAGNRAALSGMPVRHSPPARRVTEAKFFLREVSERNVQSFIPQMASACFCRCCGSAAGDKYAFVAVEGKPHRSRVPLYGVARNGKDHLRENSCKGA